MLYIRLLIVILILSLLSWVVLKLVRKPMHFGLVFIFWTAAVLATMFLLYGMSVFMAGA